MPAYMIKREVKGEVKDRFVFDTDPVNAEALYRVVMMSLEFDPESTFELLIWLSGSAEYKPVTMYRKTRSIL